MECLKERNNCSSARANFSLATVAIGICVIGVFITGILAAKEINLPGKLVYRDVFSGSGRHVLTGTKPGVDTTGASWTYNGNGAPAGDDWRANGAAPAKSGFGTLDYLPLHVEVGRIYSLSCVLAPDPGTTGRWFALGFFDHSHFGKSKTEGPWMTLTDTAGWATYVGSPNLRSNHMSHSLSHSVPLGRTAEIILNTSGKHWTVRWFYNGRSLGSHTYAANPTKIGGVGIAVYNGQQGKVRNFEVRMSPGIKYQRE